MASKKKSPVVKPGPEKSLMEKISETAVHLKEEIIAGKDQLIETAGEKFEEVKEAIKKYRAKKAKPAKKGAAKAAKKIVKKISKAVKVAPVKKRVIAKAPVKKKAAVSKGVNLPEKKAPVKKKK